MTNNEKETGDQMDRWSRLVKERDDAREKAEEAWKEIDDLEARLQSAQQEIERLKLALHTHESYDKTVTEMYEREQKLIEGLRFYNGDWTEVNRGEYAREILQELGVTE